MQNYYNSLLENWDDLAVNVLYLLNRKEISLNRRLYQWFLGSGNKKPYSLNHNILSLQLLTFFYFPIAIQEMTHLKRVGKKC
jgi:hypothetical protein